MEQLFQCVLSFRFIPDATLAPSVMAVIVFFVRLADVARSLSESVVERVSLVERCDLDPCGLASDLFRDLRE